MEFGGMYEAYARKIGHGGRLRVRDYQTGYKVQFIGHGIGLELIEQPILSVKDDSPPNRV